jgi:hypothetical protein
MRASGARSGSGKQSMARWRFVVEYDLGDDTTIRDAAEQLARFLHSTHVYGNALVYPVFDEPDDSPIDPTRVVHKQGEGLAAQVFSNLYAYRSHHDIEAFDSQGEDHSPAINFMPILPTQTEYANLYTSRVRGFVQERHMPLIDVDQKVMVLHSKTPGHYHLAFPNITTTWDRYHRLLRALYSVGIIQEGYYRNSVKRHATFVRAWPTPSGFRYNDPQQDDYPGPPASRIHDVAFDHAAPPIVIEPYDEDKEEPF